MAGLRSRVGPGPFFCAQERAIPTNSAKSSSRQRGLRRGNPGNKGGGRKTAAFAQECERLADQVVLAKVAAYLDAHDLGTNRDEDANWKWCADYVTGYGKGKPTQPLSAPPEGTTFTLTFAKDEP